MQQVAESGKDKIKQICGTLRKETLEPAIQEAKNILEEAQKRAEHIIVEAKQKAKSLITLAEKEIEKKQEVFRASLHQGARQSMEWLKQEIELRLLNQNLGAMIAKATSTPEILAEMVRAVVKAISEEGIQTDLSVIIPTTVKPRSVNELLGKEILEQLKEKSVIIGPKKGGIEVKLHKENITIELSDTALLELMTRYIRKDFHQFFFTKQS